ncbi:NAD(P)-dependent oxidoreductase [Deinococcus sp. Arct2-2]|uniref:NAD-dependent epimerase/dehydratase family protein n=1 Tax=Deinococcus sp. Arct2-2 TaxID=2568653 RepID=UPI0010A431FB|nr:NAD(P)-dependent oxidoreductase [Deinococcus sp. Arct2-2]THF71624.1 NAD(P)-dependent oxidoreductase [Deinococcus sp. Arct2-2]
MQPPHSPTPRLTRVLLLGGGGFIGLHIGRRLRQQPDLLTLVGPPRAQLDLVRASASAWDCLITAARPDVIINAAGRVSGTPQELFDGNMLIVSGLLASLNRLQLWPWLVHLGSAAEYGVTAPGLPVKEDAPCHPVSPYGVGKLAATQLIQEALHWNTARGVVLRVFNPLGAGQSGATLPGHAASLLREAMRQPNSAPSGTLSFGDLSSKRDYVDVRDVARAAVFAAHLGQCPSEFVSAALQPSALPSAGVLNVGSGQARPSRAVVSGLAQLAGFTGRITETAPSSPRSDTVQSQQASIQQLCALGWSPHYTFEDALHDLWFHPSPLDWDAPSAFPPGHLPSGSILSGPSSPGPRSPVPKESAHEKSRI